MIDPPAGQSHVPDLSVVIPVFNRGELLRHTIESVHQSAGRFKVEIVLVDDGSVRPVSADIEQLNLKVDRVIRQENQGLLFARLTGLKEARGKRTLFLDSDDFLSPAKLRVHLEEMQGDDWDVTYTDASKVKLSADGPEPDGLVPDAPYREAEDSPDFFRGPTCPARAGF